MKRLSLFILLGIILITTTSCGNHKVENPQKAASKATPKEVVQEEAQSSGKYISKDIIELVKDCISKGKDLEYLKKYSTGRILTGKDIAKLNIQGEEKELLKTVIAENDYDASEITLVDIDNDGSDEIAVYQYSGGTAGFIYFYVLKKDIKGVYKFTYPQKGYSDGENFGTLSDQGFVKIKGKTYYLTQGLDYDSKIYSGIGIDAFDKGNLVEQGFVGKYGDKIKANTQYVLNHKYDKMIDKLRTDTPKIIASLDDGEAISGKIEKPVPQKRIQKYEDELNVQFQIWNEIDWDNNGLPDLIGKVLFFPSTISTKRQLEYPTYVNLNGKLQNINILDYYKISLSKEEPNVQQLWFESFEGKNYTLVLNQVPFTNTYGLYVYLINNTKVQKIGQIQFKYIEEIKVNIHKPE